VRIGKSVDRRARAIAPVNGVSSARIARNGQDSNQGDPRIYMTIPCRTIVRQSSTSKTDRLERRGSLITPSSVALVFK
jgi:hypothetical protein